jgi:serine/threonine protein phosphatase 1
LADSIRHANLLPVRWIVGDIHGMHQSLKGLIRAVGDNDPNPQWLFVGDYVNRGPDSRGVIETLLQLPNARFCRGNHDDVFDLIINGQSYAPQPSGAHRGTAFKWFMEHGLADTLASYGADVGMLQAVFNNPTESGLDAVTAHVPRSHREFIRNLLPIIEEPDIFIIHARWDPITPDEDPAPTMFLEVDPSLRKVTTWGRFTIEEVDGPKSWRRVGFFGHTPVDSYGARGGFDPKGGGSLIPIVGDRVVLVDTACALSPVGRLTAFCPDNNSYLQVDRKGNPVNG